MGNHYVPKYYLKGFAQNDRIWVYDRNAKREFLSQPKVVAHETAMYPGEVEKYLENKVEGPAKSAIEKVRHCEAISEDDRILLANYIINLWKRVPEARNRTKKRMPEVTSLLKDEFRQSFHKILEDDPSLDDQVRTRQEEVERIIAEYEKDPPPEIWFHVLKNESTPRVVDSLLSMEWRFLHTKDIQFLTCDNPVFIFESVGVGNHNSELTIPFSSDVALWANRRKDIASGYLNATSVTVKEINRRTAHNATRFVYSIRNESWILPFVCKNKYKLHWLL